MSNRPAKGSLRKPTLTLDDQDEDEIVVTPKSTMPQFKKRTKKMPLKPAGSMTTVPDSQIAKSLETPKATTRITSFEDGGEEDEDTTFQIRKTSKKTEKKVSKFKAMMMAPPPVQQQESDSKGSSSYFGSTADDYSAERLQQMREEVAVRLIQAPAPEDYVDPEELRLYTTELAPGVTSEVEPMEEEHDSIIVINSDDELPNASLIPTQDRIEEIRRKRDNFRQLGFTKADFVSLRGNDADMDRMLLGGKLDNEPEYDSYGDAATNRRTFGDTSKMASIQKEQQRKMVLDFEEEEEDEDTKEWQDAVLKKVGIKTGRKTLVVDDFDAIGHKPMLIEEELEDISQYDPLSYEPPSVDFIIQKLKDKVKFVDDAHGLHLHQLDNIESKLEEAKKKKHAFEGQEEDFEDEVNFFRNLRDFSFDLMDCLNEKSVELEKLGARLEDKAVIAANAMKQQRQLNIQDELEEVRAILNKSKVVETLEKENRRKDRVGHQKRKRERRQQQLLQGQHVDPEGWSSDDSEYVNYTQDIYQQDKEEIISSVLGLFDDVYEDFSSLAPIASKFEAWKKKYPESYRQAYGSESLQKISETYVLQEFLTRWDLLNFCAINYTDHEWFEILSDIMLWDDKDNDSVLVPNMVAVTLNKIKPIFVHCYDPYSLSQTRNAINIFREINIYITSRVPAVEKKLHELETALFVTLQDAVDRFLLLFPSSEMNVDQVRDFCLKQFWLGVKLLNNCMQWLEVISHNTVAFEQTVVNELLNNKLLPYLRKLRFLEDAQLLLEACVKISHTLALYMQNYQTCPKTLLIFQDFVERFANFHVTQKILDAQRKSQLLRIFLDLKNNSIFDKLSAKLELEY